jgi:hypothetical protein
LISSSIAIASPLPAEEAMVGKYLNKSYPRVAIQGYQVRLDRWKRLELKPQICSLAFGPIKSSALREKSLKLVQ